MYTARSVLMCNQKYHSFHMKKQRQKNISFHVHLQDSLEIFLALKNLRANHETLSETNNLSSC